MLLHRIIFWLTKIEKRHFDITIRVFDVHKFIKERAISHLIQNVSQLYDLHSCN